jgi:hypothetical protein
VQPPLVVVTVDRIRETITGDLNLRRTEPVQPVEVPLERSQKTPDNPRRETNGPSRGASHHSRRKVDPLEDSSSESRRDSRRSSHCSERHRKLHRGWGVKRRQSTDSDDEPSLTFSQCPLGLSHLGLGWSFLYSPPNSNHCRLVSESIFYFPQDPSTFRIVSVCTTGAHKLSQQALAVRLIKNLSS